MCDRVEGLGRVLLRWPFWVIAPVALAIAWWLANQRLGTAATYSFWIAFGGTGAWILSALWLGAIWLRNAVRWRPPPRERGV